MNVHLNHPKVIEYFQSHPNISPEYVLVSTLPILELVTSSENSESSTVSKLEVLFNNMNNNMNKSLQISHNSLESCFNNMLQIVQQHQDSMREKLESSVNRYNNDFETNLLRIIEQNNSTSKSDTTNKISLLLKEHESRFYEFFAQKDSDVVKSIHSAFNDNKLHLSHTLEYNLNNLQSSVYDKLSTHSTRISDTIENKLQPISQTIENVQQNVHNFTSVSQNSSIKGSISENRLRQTLITAFPNAEITDTHKSTASGDYIIKHHEINNVLIENKDYSDNVPHSEVEKFYRDIFNQQCHGIFISQSSGIAHKNNFHVEFIHGFVTVFLHHVNYDHLHIVYAAHIIKSLMHIAASCHQKSSTNINTDINLANDEIEKLFDEWKKHNTQKNSIINTLNAQIKLLRESSLPTLETFLRSRFISEFPAGYVCPVCNKVCKSAGALSSHVKTHNKKPEPNSSDNMVE